MPLVPTQISCKHCKQDITITDGNVKSIVKIGNVKTYSIQCPKCQKKFDTDLSVRVVRNAETRSSLMRPLSYGQTRFIAEGNYSSGVVHTKYNIDPVWQAYSLTALQNVNDQIDYLTMLGMESGIDFSFQIEKLSAEADVLMKEHLNAKGKLIDRGELDVNDL